MTEITYNATAIEDGTFLAIEGGFALDKPLANGTSDDATTFLDKLSDRADKLSDKALLEYTKHRSVADQLTQKEKIGVAIGTAVALTLLITCGCCCWKRRRGTKVSKKGGKTGVQMTKYKEPLVQVKVEERPWTNSFFKWEQKKGTIEHANGDVYEGELSDGQPHGWGVLRTPDATHEGEWKDGKKHGKGVILVLRSPYRQWKQHYLRQEYFFAYPCRIKFLTSALFHPSIPNKIDSIDVFSFTLFGCWSEPVQRGGAQLTTTRFCVRHSVSSYNSGGSASPPLQRAHHSAS